MEQERVQKRLLELGVHLHLTRELVHVAQTSRGLMLQLGCVYTGQETELACANLLMVTMRDSHDQLYQQLLVRESEWAAAGIVQISPIGDSYAPGTIAAAVYAGHKAARQMDAEPLDDQVPFKREMMRLHQVD
jgi:dimethylamine/trimethylamine dehydrogenase